jgi:oligopeptide/dipeptide ABC transporter ATP-binding protein
MLEARDLVVEFGPVRAVEGVSLDLPDGPFGLGLVGESGSGKTTVGRALLRLVPLSGGTVTLDGADVLALRGRALRGYRRTVQVVFQDPDSTLDPRVRVGAAVAEGLRVHGVVPANAVGERVRALLDDVGLDPAFAERFPHELSGGQRQRVAIARALAVEPRVLVLDEPTSALDVTVQARILALIGRLRAEHRLAYLLISHNLAVVEQLCERIAVLYLGRLVELADAAELLGSPAHPYTQALRAAVPEIDLSRRRERLRVAGDPPDPAAPPSGCPFHPRCPLAVDVCRAEMPRLREIVPRHLVACHRAEDAIAGAAAAPDAPP